MTYKRSRRYTYLLYILSSPLIPHAISPPLLSSPHAISPPHFASPTLPSFPLLSTWILLLNNISDDLNEAIDTLTFCIRVKLVISTYIHYIRLHYTIMHVWYCPICIQHTIFYCIVCTSIRYIPYRWSVCVYHTIFYSIVAMLIFDCIYCIFTLSYVSSIRYFTVSLVIEFT